MSDPTIINVGGEGGFGGLYNAIFGDGMESDRIILCAITIGMEPNDLARPRDAWVEEDLELGARWALYTRLGGGNREGYAEAIAKLQANQYYLHDADDTLDTTYATFYFRLPERLPDDAPEQQQEEWAGMREQLVQQAVEPVDMSVVWQAAIDKMQDPEFANAILEKSGLGQQLAVAFANLDQPEEGKE